MNEQQRKALEILKVCIDICEKWDIRYYMVCGSALGAVKYQGFIPWDDDIDVGMLRPDYERFLEVAQQELPEGYFLQNYRTQPVFPHAYTKLRDSNTTFIEADVVEFPINHGIYIDIFPLDGYPEGRWKEKLFCLRRKLYEWMRIAALPDSPKRWVRVRNRIFRILGCHKRTAAVQKKLEKLYLESPVENSKLWCNFGNWQRELEYAPRAQYGQGTWGTFEGLRVRIPENYDAYLTQKYGDWRSDPPKEAQKSHHVAVVCDVNRPYTEYLKNKDAAKK